MTQNPTSDQYSSECLCGSPEGLCVISCPIHKESEKAHIENEVFNKYLHSHSLPFLNLPSIHKVLQGKARTYRYSEQSDTLQNVQTTPVNDYSGVCAALKNNMAAFAKAQTQNMTHAIRDALDNELIALIMFKKFLLEGVS